jgi:hypothetical protein
MYASQPAGAGPVTEQGLFGRCLTWLTTNLLVAYLLAVAAQRLWALLHSPVK